MSHFLFSQSLATNKLVAKPFLVAFMQMRSSVDALTHDYEYNNNNNINNADAKTNHEGHP